MSLKGRKSSPASQLLTVDNRLRVIQSEVADCQECGLALIRTNTVFAAGNPLAKMVILGEGPGDDEDREGFPFVGKAGKLIDRILETFSLVRERDVYIMNTVKCRAHDITEGGRRINRPPTEDELKACSGFFDRQMDNLPNKVIVVALGSTAAHRMLSRKAQEFPVIRMRNSFIRTRYGVMVVTYHPSYLLRPDNAERKAWVYSDFEKAVDFMNRYDPTKMLKGFGDIDIEDDQGFNIITDGDLDRGYSNNPYEKVGNEKQKSWGVLKDFQKGDEFSEELTIV